MVVAMSGGVDSSVAAALLLRAGYDVVGVTLQLRSCQEQTATRSCCSEDGIAAARSVARGLGIPHCVLDCHQEFSHLVLRPAWEEYARGRTPNPCVICNRALKFGVLLEYAQRLGARFLATGHYARIAHREGRPRLLRGCDRDKDQSYFLFALSDEQLRRVLFPLGDHTKSAVRELARGFGLPSAERRESQDACLVTDGEGFAESLRQLFREPCRPGSFVDRAGRVLGPHQGIHCYTIGQRRGLGIALGQRAFVAAIHAAAGDVVVTCDGNELEARSLVARQVVWHESPPARAAVQICYRHAAVPAEVAVLDEQSIRITFDAPVRAVTPGQAAVLFAEERLLGGG